MTSPAAQRHRPPGRYDQPSLVGQRLLAVVLGTLFVALLAAIVYAFAVRFDEPDVRFREVGFAALSDTVVRVDFEVTKAPGATAFCTVRAREADGSETGRELVEIGPGEGGERSVRVSHRLTTIDRAVTGEVDGCSLQPPPAGPGAP